MVDADDSAANYYIRVRGRVLGPYSIEQLKTLRGRGQFGRANEVSTDSQVWRSAATIEHLFEGGSSKKSRSAAEATEREKENSLSVPPSRTMQPVWHYSIGEEPYGPVTSLELRGLISSNQLVVNDLVWKEGFTDWIAIRDVPELNSVAVSKSSVSIPMTSTGPSFAQIYCYACGSPTDARAEVCPKCGVRQDRSTRSGKSRISAALLALFLGGFGIHHFYLGNTLLGVIYLLFCWTLVPGIIALVEGIFLLCMSDASFNKQYANA